MKWLAVLLLGAFVFICLVSTKDVLPKTPTHTDSSPRDIYRRATSGVRSLLKAPSTAEFSGYDDHNSYAVHLGNGVWSCGGTVDAQNVFGAKLRQEWELIFTPQTGLPLFARIGNQTSGDRSSAERLAERKPSPAATPAVKAPATQNPRTVPTGPDAEAAQRRAVARYPELGKAGSALNVAFVQATQKARTERPHIFDNPEWPTVLAAELAPAN